MVIETALLEVVVATGTHTSLLESLLVVGTSTALLDNVVAASTSTALLENMLIVGTSTGLLDTVMTILLKYILAALSFSETDVLVNAKCAFTVDFVVGLLVEVLSMDDLNTTLALVHVMRRHCILVDVGVRVCVVLDYCGFHGVGRDGMGINGFRLRWDI